MLLRKWMCVLALGSFGWAAAQAPVTNHPSDETTPANPSAPPVMPGVSAGSAAPVVQTPDSAQATTSPVTGQSNGAQVSQTGGTKVHGFVTDPDGAAIPGATVSLQPKTGNAVKVVSGGDGSYVVSVAPGNYSMLVTMKGFASYSLVNLKVPAVAGISVDAKLAVGETEQVVNVEASALQVSVDQDSNASSTILTGKDLDALSDDPDELQSELTALAGPSAGPNGGQIYVDGFTGGQLPPKSSIREIRINQNPFSAQYDRLGFGRIEIFTKPGTDQFHGSYQINGNPSQFNAGAAPNQQASTYVPPYHTVYMFGSISGPMSKWASFNVGGSHRDIEDDAYFNGTLVSLPGSTTLCAPGTLTCTAVASQSFTHEPQSRTDFTPRFDLALGKNNVLTVRFQVNQNDKVNQNVGGFNLPETGYYSSQSSFETQISDTQTYGLHVINETRGEWERERTHVTPTSSGTAINLTGYFQSGGYTGGTSDDHTNHLEFQNYTSIQTKKNFIRLGGRLRSNQEAIDEGALATGEFTYSSLTGYLAGTANQFTKTVVNNHDINYDLVDLGLYAETDWKPLPNLTVSYGLRYEVQNHFQEHHDFAPRASFAYGLGKGKNPTTVLRGGVGFFYDRFGASSVLNLLEQNGQNSYVSTLTSATITATGCSPTNLTACVATPTTVYTEPDAAHHMTSPYIIQTAIGADQQLWKLGTLSINYLHALGVHELAVEDAFCNPNAGSLCQNSKTFNYQYLTEGQFHEDQLIVNPKVQLAKWFSLFGYYSLTTAGGDNSGASTFLSHPGNINADLGRPTFDIRHRLFAAGSVTLPHYIQLSPFLIAQSGNPFNITEGVDINGDGIYNDRPYVVTNGMSAAQLNAAANAVIKATNPTAQTVTVANSIPGCGTYLSQTAPASIVPQGSTIVRTNDCTGPAQFTLNLRVTKTWGFGGARDKSKDAVNSGGRGQGGPGGGSHTHGGSGGPGGGPGGFGGGGASTAQRYNFALGAAMNNITNRANLATPIGTLTSPYFGRSTQLASGPYNTNDAAFRLSLTASFTF